MAKKISVIERRLQGQSALRAESLPIPLKEARVWTLRWMNAELRPDRVWQAINVLGWEYVSSEDIACPLEEIGATERDLRVVRGERGKEVLLKIRTSDYKLISQKKNKENLSITFDKKRLKDAVVNATGSEHGSQAAEFINKHAMTVTDSRERVQVDE